MARRHRVFEHHHRERIGCTLAVGFEISSGEELLGIGQFRLASQVEPRNSVKHPGNITGALVPGVELDPEQAFAAALTLTGGLRADRWTITGGNFVCSTAKSTANSR